VSVRGVRMGCELRRKKHREKVRVVVCRQHPCGRPKKTPNLSARADSLSVDLWRRCRAVTALS
jgi:hypothetical protein